jgi:hypothetical protein
MRNWVLSRWKDITAENPSIHDFCHRVATINIRLAWWQVRLEE